VCVCLYDMQKDITSIVSILRLNFFFGLSTCPCLSVDIKLSIEGCLPKETIVPVFFNFFIKKYFSGLSSKGLCLVNLCLFMTLVTLINNGHPVIELSRCVCVWLRVCRLDDVTHSSDTVTYASEFGST
jgi:hypothetical protein